MKNISLRLENNELVFSENDLGDFYYIGINRLNNTTKIMWWIHHLSDKRWFTRELCRKFIGLCSGLCGLEMYEGEG